MRVDLEKPRILCNHEKDGRECFRRTVACRVCGRLILWEHGDNRRRMLDNTVCSLCSPAAWGCAGDPFAEED